MRERLVEQHQQNVIHQQLNANEALKKEVERKQFTVNDTEEIDELNDEEKEKEQKRIRTNCLIIRRKNKKKNKREHNILLKETLLIIVDRTKQIAVIFIDNCDYTWTNMYRYKLFVRFRALVSTFHRNMDCTMNYD